MEERKIIKKIKKIGGVPIYETEKERKEYEKLFQRELRKRDREMQLDIYKDEILAKTDIELSDSDVKKIAKRLHSSHIPIEDITEEIIFEEIIRLLPEEVSKTPYLLAINQHNPFHGEFEIGDRDKDLIASRLIELGVRPSEITSNLIFNVALELGRESPEYQEYISQREKEEEEIPELVPSEEYKELELIEKSDLPKVFISNTERILESLGFSGDDILRYSDRVTDEIYKIYGQSGISDITLPKVQQALQNLGIRYSTKKKKKKKKKTAK